MSAAHDPAAQDLAARILEVLPREGRTLLLDGGECGALAGIADLGVERRSVLAIAAGAGTLPGLETPAPEAGAEVGVGAELPEPEPPASGTERCTGAGAWASGEWQAVVVAARRPAEGWHGLLGVLRPALAESGRLLLAIPEAHDQSATRAVVADAVASLYESRYCVLDERTVALDPGASAARAALLTARPDPFAVRSYREGDQAAILELFAKSFSPPRGVEHWRWKYRDNPFGALAISGAFSPQGELVAHYAAYPVRFRRAHGGGAETILCHQVGDTMTERGHRHVGRGRTSLLARTARHFYARRCEGRVAFNYGFNTGNIQRFSQLFVGARKVWDIELRRAAVAGLRLAPPRRFRPYRVTVVAALDASFDELFERAAPAYGLLVERRRPYLDWRYLRCPDRGLVFLRADRGSRLAGWSVFRRVGERLVWGDALIDPQHPGAASALLRHATANAGGATEPPLAVEGWFSRHPRWWSDLLEELGFEVAPEPQGLGMVYVPFLEDPHEELGTRYYLTWGDSDLF